MKLNPKAEPKNGGGDGGGRGGFLAGVWLLWKGRRRLAASAWGVFGRLDIISVAEGKIIPSGKVKEIQPYDRGVVGSILVAEGQLVGEGQALITFDQAQTMADEARLEAELRLAEPRRRRRQVLAGLLMMPGRQPDGYVRSHPGLGGDEENGGRLLEEYSAIASRLEALGSRVSERRAELAANQAAITGFEESIPLAEERAGALRSLYERNLVGMNEHHSVKEHLIELTQGLESARHVSGQLSAAAAAAESELAAYRSESLAGALSELDELARQEAAITQELAKARDLRSKQTLYSPVRGTVKGLLANTVGGVVSPGQVLMEIVPLGEVLEVEAFLGNQDIGYVKAGQPAEVKVATFPFTKYGVINAVVSNVADDATVDEKLGLVYRVRLELASGSIMVDGEETPLLPGMAVSAEIATGKRRVIEYVLAPLLRMKDESIRER
jgi:hemolysin D